MITFNRICETLKGRVLQTSPGNPSIAHVLLDSRKLIFTEQALFIAIKGKHNNSHQFLQDVYDAGVRNFIVEENNFHKNQIDALVQANIFAVSNGIKALQSIAKIHRQNFHYPVVGITGSNGKTIVKEWLAHLLKDQLHIVKNPKSYNSQIGVPLSVLQMQDVHQMGIFEAGISEPNEMQVLQEIIRPNLGILTMLGDAHDEGFATKLEKLSEKSQLFQECSSVIYGADQELVHSYFLGLNQAPLQQFSHPANVEMGGVQDKELFAKDTQTFNDATVENMNKQSSKTTQIFNDANGENKNELSNKTTQVNTDSYITNEALGSREVLPNEELGDKEVLPNEVSGSRENLAKNSSLSAKFDALKNAVVVKDARAKKYISWSRQDEQADYFIETKVLANTTQLHCNNWSLEIPFTDEASIWNACTCLCFLLVQGSNMHDILPRFADLPALDMRLQLKEAHQNCLLINDSYSADLGSLRIALEFMEQHAEGLEKTVILSDFLESGKSNTNLYQTIAQLLQAHQVQCFIGIGSAIGKQQHLFTHKHQYFYESTRDFLNQFQLSDFHQQIILLKGARSFAFERIGKWLEKKMHQTVFEINLESLVHNLHVYQNLLKPQVKVMAMVKAFSYGAGSYEIARMLQFNRVDYLTVAYADEGVALRKAKIKTPIMVMNPEPHSFDVILQYNLEPEIYHFEILQALVKSADGEEVGIHIELDSGMKRLGFDANEIPALLDILLDNPNLKVRSIFTHLAASEDPSHDAFTLDQIAKFDFNSASIQSQFSYPILRHCLNSGGIARFAHAQFDMVRLGIGLYGVDPSPQQLSLQPIGTLKTVISQIREIGVDESIGYGRRGQLSASGRIAIVAIGYADGLDRKLSNGVGSMLVNGQLAPIVGNICMDMTMLDVSAIPCSAGDEVIVFGENPSIHQVSDWIGTIPYEVLTGISQRVKRVYFGY
jgi:alanine racemase